MKTNKLSNRKVTTSTGKLPDSFGFSGSGQGIIRPLTAKETAKQPPMAKSIDPKPVYIKVNCPNCYEFDKTRQDFDFPETIACCDHCGADFYVETGEIILDPNEIK